MHRSQIRIFTAATLALAAGFSIAATPGAAQVTCGSTVTGKAVMATDLVCVTDPGFAIGDKGSVDMAGHTVTACAGCTGVALTGQGGKLLNGTVIASGAGSVGVALLGNGVHQIYNVASVGAETGFYITSDGCKLQNCAATGVADFGFRSFGSKTSISRSHASGGSGAIGFEINGSNCFINENTAASSGANGFLVNGNAVKLTRNASVGGDDCLVVNGDSNKLTQNTATGCSNNGIEVNGNDNKVSKSVAAGNGNDGMVLVGDDNKLTKNTSSDNGGNGLFVAGNGNNVGSGNTNRNGAAGIRIDSGSANGFKSNVTLGNDNNGVLVNLGATDNALSKTVGLGSGDVDLQDDNANCGGNVWAKSIFGTSEVGGVPSLLCIQ